MKRRGFTLIELLIVVVIIGLIAAIAIPQLSTVKERAYVATMKSDLRNFSQHEESYFYDHGVYTPDLTDLSANGFQPSPLVTVSIPEAHSAGWSATTSHTLSNVECAIFVGTAAPLGAASDEGKIVCQ